MYSPYRERTVNLGDCYKVYRNLNNKMFSLIAVNGEFKGKIVAHAECVTLHDVLFVVSEASRIRACREGNRNVHAFAIGILTSFKCHNDSALGRLSAITYNPFLNSTFAFITNQQPITTATATKVILQHGKAYATP